MANEKLVVKDKQAFIHGLDMSGLTNEAMVEMAIEQLDASVYNSLGRKWSASLQDPRVTLQSFVFDVASGTVVQPDAHLFSRRGKRAVFALSFEDNEVGSLAYALDSILFGFEISNPVAQLTQYALSLVGGTMIRGIISFSSFNPTDGAPIIANANGVAHSLGAVATGEKLYSAVLAVDPIGGTGPTLDVVVESDDDSGMASPTTRITHAQITNLITAELLTADGPITDTWYRHVFSVAGTSPSYPVFAVLGIA